MPISTSLYTELRFTISNYMQRRDWKRLFETCGTNDDEVARTIGVIMAIYDPNHLWAFLDYVLALSRHSRLENERSVATVCYIIARMGQSNVRKSLSYLREFLSENQSLRDPVMVSLSNLWVLDTRKVSKLLFKSWILRNDSKLVQEVAVRSCEYLAENAPAKVTRFLEEVISLPVRSEATNSAKQLLVKYTDSKRVRKRRLLKNRKQKRKREHKRRKK